MKIIINQPRASYFVGGAEMISLDHAINLLHLGHEISFITILPKSINLNYSPQFEKFKKEYSEKINIIEIEQDKKIEYIYDIQPGEDRCRWNVESIFYNQKLYEYINYRRKKFDVIFSYYNLDAVFIPRKYIRKNVLYLCGIPKEQNDFQGSFLSAYDKVLAISNEVKQSWEKYCRYEIKVVSTGVDCNRFAPSITPRIHSNKKRLLYVGRLIERKNVDKIIYAYEQLKKDYELELTIVGDGPERKKLELIKSDCIFTGTVSNTENYYRNADIFISPSVYGEGLQGTILEAMSSGMTVVATNTQINRQLLSDDRGYVIEPNLESIINGIKKALEISDSTKMLKNRTYILDNYNWQIKAKEILEELK